MEPEERSHAGLFMSFQTPVEIPGVSNMDFLLMAANAKRKKHGQPELSPLEVCISIVHGFLSLNFFRFEIVEVWFFHYAPLRADFDLLNFISSSRMSFMNSMSWIADSNRWFCFSAWIKMIIINELQLCKYFFSRPLEFNCVMATVSFHLFLL